MTANTSIEAPENKKMNKIVDNKDLINILYSALLLYLVITFADKLFQGLIHHSNVIDLWLYTILWVAFVIQTTYAYIHIRAVPQENYTIRALFSDGLDIFLEIFICAAIGSTCRLTVYHELNSYLFLSIPFMLMAVNQFYWYVVVDEFNPRAILCLSLLFVGMVFVIVSEALYHSIWNLVFIVIWHSITMAIFRIIDKTPKSFEEKVKPIWENIKEIAFVQKIAWGKYNYQQ